MDRYSQYERDRFGNSNPKLDQLRAQGGNSGADADNDGIVTIAGGDTGNDVVVYELPRHADQALLDLVSFHNNSGAAGTFRILEATLDNAGNITDTTRRSVLINVANGATRVIGYEGEPFTGDAIAVNSGISGEVGVAVLEDHKQYTEEATQQS